VRLWASTTRQMVAKKVYLTGIMERPVVCGLQKNACPETLYIPDLDNVRCESTIRYYTMLDSARRTSYSTS